VLSCNYFSFFSCKLAGDVRRITFPVGLEEFSGADFKRITIKRELAIKMKVSSSESSLVQTPAALLARFNGSHGYRFDGDTVHLNAVFALLHPDAHDRSWALQLWACPSAPASAQDLDGHKVAEVALPPMGELADESESFAVTGFTRPPAGTGDYTMVLVLASGRPGGFDEVHDFSVYPNRQEFIQPRINGNVFYWIDGARVQISVGRIENPRAVENTSGTLALELWALTEPYQGGSFEGHHLAGVEIGTLDGQNELTLAPIDLAFTQPPVGNWQITLLLREWTANGYVTRDFTNFSVRYVSVPAIVAAPAPVVEKLVAPAVEKTLKPAAIAAPAPVLAKAPEVAAVKAPEAIVNKAVASVVAKAPTPVSAATPVPAPVAKPAAALAPVKPAAAAPVAKGVSINSAKVEDLAAVKGLTTKLAQGIVKQRPYSSLEDLRRVKGLGAAILAKVKSSLRL
jgi:DNA uptake protein ComE-like DNA-binding protein